MAYLECLWRKRIALLPAAVPKKLPTLIANALMSVGVCAEMASHCSLCSSSWSCWYISFASSCTWLCFGKPPIEDPPVYTVASSPSFPWSSLVETGRGSWAVTMGPIAEAYPESVKGPRTYSGTSSTGALEPSAPCYP